MDASASKQEGMEKIPYQVNDKNEKKGKNFTKELTKQNHVKW